MSEFGKTRFRTVDDSCYLSEIEKVDITPDYYYIVSITVNKKQLYLTFMYKNKFIVQKFFDNTYNGKIQLNSVKLKFNTEDKFKQYLGLSTEGI